MAKPGWICLASALSAALPACNGPAPGPPLPSVDLGPSLDATGSDPILLTFAAPRARSSYLVDQGYSLAWDDRGVPSFGTQGAGDFGVALEVDGLLVMGDDDLITPFTVTHTASDSAVLSFAVDDLLSGEIWFSVDSSRVATIDVRLTSTAVYPRRASIFPWLRRCRDPFTDVAGTSEGLTARHTDVTDLADALAGDEAPIHALGAASCGSGAYDDLGLMINREAPPPKSAEILGLRFDRELPSSSSVELRFRRALADAASPGSLDTNLAAARALDPRKVLLDGKARLDAIPPRDGLSREDALLYRSSFTLLDQVTMPAEGKLAHDSYVLSREPTFSFAKLGQRVHESLSMILLAHLDPQEAVAVQRNFIDRVEPDGYLPYSIGPVVDQTENHIAAAPLFSFESWEIQQIAKDDAFLADAYAAGQKIHEFWVKQRDADQDGLSEWGSAAESARGPDDVISGEVASPPEVEAVDLNCMLVMEERSLAALANALGLAADAASWTSAAEARAAKINSSMWDAATGFYYPVARDTNTFTYKAKDDLKRMEIAGLLPLWAGIVPDDRRPALLAKLADPSLFLRPNGVASLSAQDPSYTPGASGWTGPAAVPWSFLLWRGLRAYGEVDLARELEQRTRASVREGLTRDHLFHELYDPDDAGAPSGAEPSYVWSAMAALMMIEGG